MAVATANITTAAAGVNKVWRYMQSPILKGVNFMCEEVQLIKDMKSFGTEFSPRMTELVLDLNEGGRTASIPEGGWKARPASPNAELGSVTLQQFDSRFTMSQFAKWVDQGNKNQLETQFKWQAKKSVQSMGRHVADYAHGSSSAVLALTDSDIANATPTLTLHSGYGNAGITNPAFIADKFREGDGTADTADFVAIINGSSLVEIGYITARSTSTPSLTLQLNNSASISTNGLKIVKANSLENTSLDGTDFNRGLVGFQDILFGASLHGLTHANWVPGFTNADGGRLNGIRLRQAIDTMEDRGPADEHKIDRVVLTKGVYRDMIDYERTRLRFSDPFDMEIDGDVKRKGLKFWKSRRVPPGYAIPYASSALRKIMYKPVPAGDGKSTGGIEVSDGIEYPDRSAMVFQIPVVMGLVTLSRLSFGVFTGLTEQ